LIGRSVAALLFVLLLGACGGPVPDDLAVRESVLVEFLGELPGPGVVFIAFEETGTLEWAPPPPGFVERLAAANRKLTLRSVAEAERVYAPGAPASFASFRDRSTGARGKVLSVTIEKWKGRGEATVAMVYSPGSVLGEVGNRAVVRKSWRRRWAVVKTLDSWTS
jgi:hypothetical protein